MADAGAVGVWRAAFSGALRSFETLSGLRARVEAGDRSIPDSTLVREVMLAAAGAAVAAAALRSLSESMAGVRESGELGAARDEVSSPSEDAT